MNKEITGLKNGDENPEAAAEEYIQKVTQRENWAGRVVNAKQRTEVVSSPRIGNDRRAGTLAEEGCGCHQRGGPTGWETQDGGSGCNWAMAKRTPGIFQPKPGPLNPRTPKGAACGLKVPSSWGYLEALDELSLVFTYAWCKVRLELHQNSTPPQTGRGGTKRSGQGKKAGGGEVKVRARGGYNELQLRGRKQLRWRQKE